MSARRVGGDGSGGGRVVAAAGIAVKDATRLPGDMASRWGDAGDPRTVSSWASG
ncbi:hypothetical protein [Streptomyces scabiei]|uniref:hypothetical protein n=1 Tax=Streptomyces scabiei TaxID=1930 RepID=UPI00131A84A8